VGSVGDDLASGRWAERDRDIAGGRATTYAWQLTIGAARQCVFDAIATLDGPRHWWTTVVTGSAAAGGELRFGFAGLDEQIVMRVDALQPPSAVGWSCVAHTRDDEWTGSQGGLSSPNAGAGVRAALPPYRAGSPPRW
jgi:hypothetical protein